MHGVKAEVLALSEVKSSYKIAIDVSDPWQLNVCCSFEGFKMLHGMKTKGEMIKTGSILCKGDPVLCTEMSSGRGHRKIPY